MLIAAGKNVVCIASVACQWCGDGKATKDAIYLCEEVVDGSFLHRVCCETEDCDGYVLILKGKGCCYCACCFKPLDDGDRSLVAGEDENPYDAPAPSAPKVTEPA